MLLGVLVSGKGTLLPSIAEHVPVSLVIADRACEALKVAEKLGIHTLLMPRSAYGTDLEYGLNLIMRFGQYEIEGLVCAGLRSILPKVVCNTYPDLILNCYPSLLPKYRGLHAIRDQVADGVENFGFTIHVVVPEVDAGRIIYQEPVPRLPGDTETTARARIQERVKLVYPLVIPKHFLKTPPA